MIVLFTDFGASGPYVGQIGAALARDAPSVRVIDLLHDAPAYDARRAAYLLAALVEVLPNDAVLVGVVDPGVGGDRAAIVVEADGRRFVGPDNGLFEIVLRRASARAAWTITCRPAALSSTFHGPDLFAPVAAMIATGRDVPGAAIEIKAIARPEWPDDLDEIVYIARFGNAMTGRRAATVPATAVIETRGERIARVATFSDVEPGEALWYENSNGLVEIAVNQGRASDRLGLTIGDAVRFDR